MKQLTKQEYQKRSLTISKLAQLLELLPGENISFTLTWLLHPAGETKHPSKWTDNEFLGVLEKAIKKVELYGDED